MAISRLGLLVSLQLGIPHSRRPLGHLFCPKVPLQVGAPQFFDASYAPVYADIQKYFSGKIRRQVAFPTL